MRTESSRAASGTISRRRPRGRLPRPSLKSTVIDRGCPVRAACDPLGAGLSQSITDRKSTRLNSSHGYISYAVFCLKKKNIYQLTDSPSILRNESYVRSATIFALSLMRDTSSLDIGRHRHLRIKSRRPLYTSLMRVD